MRLTIICKNCGESWFSTEEIQENPDIAEICPVCYHEDYLTQAVEIEHEQTV